MIKPSKRTLIILGCAVVLIAISAWFLFGKTTGSNSTDSTTSDWNVYSSASLGFSIAYPKDWKMQNCGEQCVGWAPGSAEQGQLALGVIKSNDTTANVLKNAKDYLTGQETIKLGGLSWLKLTLKHPTTGDIITSHFIEHDSSLFEFGTGSTEEDVVAVYEKMLASFKFLK